MATLRLLEGEPAAPRQGADLYGCAYAPDGTAVLTAGWDGFLRLWEAPGGVEVAALKVADKPLSCCAVSPDGGRWLAGSLDGLLSIHEAATHEQVTAFTAHTRPIAAIRFAPLVPRRGDRGEGAELVATAAWDRQVALRRLGRDRESHVLYGHEDIVAGCRFTADGSRLLSWSHDGTLRLWDTTAALESAVLYGHADRVTAAAPSPDGQWAVSGGRDGVVHLWDLSARTSAGSVKRQAEVRACFFLPDGDTAAVVDASGAIALLSVPALHGEDELHLGVNPLSADLSPSGAELVVGCEDGRVRFVAVDGLEGTALVVAAGRRAREARGVFNRLLGKPRLSYVYEYTCPACRRSSETSALPSQPFPCPACRRTLRVAGPVRQLQET
jgi:WD40 repeat protein